MAARTFTANFVGRTSNLEKSFKRVSKGSELMSDKLMRGTRMAGIGFGALAGVAIGAAAALKPMIDKAASMEEALSKNQLLLGDSSKAVEAFAETSLESFGVTNLAALQATGVFANLGKAMKMSEADSASMATTLTGLAGDLSSLHDVSVEEALTALRAGLIGEAEPLRKFGIFLDAATLKTKALQMGLIENTKEALAPGIKSQAAYAVILGESTSAMGDFARTADSATNVSKQLSGQWEEIQIQIGTALLPAFTALVTHLVEEVMPAIEEFFEDPSWAAMGRLSAEALTSEFSKAIGEFFLVGASWIMSPLGAALNVAKDQLGKLGYFAGTDVGTQFAVGINEAVLAGGRMDPDWDRGDWETAGKAAGDVFYRASRLGDTGLTPAAAGGGTVIPPGFGSTPPPGSGHPALPAPVFSPEAARAAQPASINPNTNLNAEQALRLLSDPTTDFSRFLTPLTPAHGGPPNTQITINATAVTPQELVDQLGQFVDLNGPLPASWTQ